MSGASVFLVVISADTAQPSPAVLRAAGLARHCHGELHLYCAFNNNGDEHSGMQALPPPADIIDSLVSSRRRALEHIAAALPDLQGRIRCEACWAPVIGDAILEAAVRIRARYVIKDVRGESVLRRALLSSLDWTLIRTLPCELLLVGAVSSSTTSRVLAAVNVLEEDPELDSGLNARIVAAARSLASHIDATVELASVAPWPSDQPQNATANAAADTRVAAHQRAFRRFAELQNIPSAHRHRVLGDPVEALATLADELEADFTVIGNIYRHEDEYRRGGERSLLGRTAEMLLQKLRTDLLITKAPSFVRHPDQGLNILHPGTARRH